MIVLDASGGVDFLLRLEPGYTGIRNRLLEVQGNVHVPHLFDLEVVHVFRRYERLGLMPASRLESAFRKLQSLQLVRYPHNVFLEQVWRLRANVTAYDAAYIALAEALGAPLITTDRPLSRATGLRVKIEVYGAAEPG